MKAILRLSATAALALASLAAAAHPVVHEPANVRWEPAAARVDAVDARQARQAARIRQGVRTGALTRAEASRLWAQQQRIQRAERHARADGVVTRAERARLMHMLDRAGQHIQRQKADGDRRPAPRAQGRVPAHDGPRGRG